jgi:hypothetical protein
VTSSDRNEAERTPGWFSLLLPVLFPAWRFFDAIGPAPSVEYALVDGEDLSGAEWREFRPRPTRRSLAEIARALVFDPVGNERLFVLACAERLADGERGPPEREIRARIARSVLAEAGAVGGARLAFRVVLTARADESVAREVVFRSEPLRLADAGAEN